MRLGLILTSPVIAVAGARVHAVKVTRRPLKSKRKTYDAVCGRRAKLLAFDVQGQPDYRMTVAWPPYVADSQEWGYERCRDCMKLAPGKPSRPPFASEATA